MLGTFSSTIFTPPKLTSLSWWVDAADTSKITNVSNAVSQWSDKSGSGWHLSQATSTLRPATNLTTRNGLNVITFDGVDDILTNTSNALFQNLAGFSWFVTFQNVNTNISRIVHKVAVTGVNNRAGFSSRRVTTKYEALARRVDADALSSATGTTDTNTTSWMLLGQICNFSAGTNVLRVNRVVEASAATTTGLVENVTGGALAVGGNPTPSQWFGGSVGEVVAYDRVLTASEITQLEEYLRNKWATV